MTNFTVDQSKCIACGLCVRDCHGDCLEMEAGLPVMKDEDKCMGCQHCLAICPQAAISIFGVQPEASTVLSAGFPEPEKLINLIKGRRSTRFYKQENVPSEKIEKLKEILPYSPTGCNAQSLRFTLIDDLEVMRGIREKTYRELRVCEQQGTIPEKRAFMTGLIEPWEKQGIDIIFRNAPHMLLVTAPDDAPCKEVDSLIALSYFELYANTIGVGTLWCGMAMYAFLEVATELRKDLQIPEDHKNGYVVLFGTPDVEYKRPISRRSNAVVTLSAKEK